MSLLEEELARCLGILTSQGVALIFLWIGNHFHLTWLTTRGRINRIPFLWRYFCFSFLLLPKMRNIALDVMELTELSVFYYLLVVIAATAAFNLVLAICTSLGMKRVQDLGQSGWWFIVLFIGIRSAGIFCPLFGYMDMILFCFLALKKGTNGANKYGEARSTDSIF